MVRDQEDAVLTSMTLMDAIKHLPIRQHVIVALRLAGYKQSECAAIVGLTSPAVGAAFRRALLRMRERMETGG
jgi:DNA-directed RNA polymerase specialized sigma24 family protein